MLQAQYDVRDRNAIVPAVTLNEFYRYQNVSRRRRCGIQLK